MTHKYLLKRMTGTLTPLQNYNLLPYLNPSYLSASSLLPPTCTLSFNNMELHVVLWYIPYCFVSLQIGMYLIIKLQMYRLHFPNIYLIIIQLPFQSTHIFSEKTTRHTMIILPLRNERIALCCSKYVIS